LDNDVEKANTPDEFLKVVAEILKDEEGVDSSMTEILQTHILKAAPAQNAVAQARDAILNLARERARLSTLEADDG
jgi:hypothetical protein